MSLHIKICGISDLTSAVAAVDAGADALGFVFYPGSARLVTPQAAAAIASRLPATIEKVAVFLRPTRDEIDAVLGVFSADRVQADHECLGNLQGTRVLPVFRQGTSDVPHMRDGERFLYEGPRSGVGEPVDWGQAARLASRGRMTLAGGLSPGNVAEAISEVRPFGVDVSSGVEVEPGIKDPALIREFVEAARETERETIKT